MKLILVTLEVFHLDKSGNIDKELQSQNTHFMFLTLEVSHFDISGIELKFVQK